MIILKASLENLISNLSQECSIVHRATGGYKLVFMKILSETCLVKLIAYCKKYHYSYYISACDSIIEFQIYE